MIKQFWLLCVFVLMAFVSQGAKDTLNTAKPDTIHQVDSVTTIQILVPRNLLDSTGKAEWIRKYFFLHENISGNAVVFQQKEKERDLPRLKAIRLRKTENENWKFWVLAGTILFLALIRLMNVKRFDEIMLSAFDLHTDFKAYSDKTGNYFMSNLGLFINFILSVSLFIATLLENTHRVETTHFNWLFWQIAFIALVIYTSKILINLTIGSIFKMRSFSTIVLFNTIMVNNILGVGLVFLNLFYVFADDIKLNAAIAALMLILLLVAVIYRVIKNVLMTTRIGSFQFIYIFLYLCALEILPWLVVFKMFLNGW